MTKKEAKWLAKQQGISSRSKFVLFCLMTKGCGTCVQWNEREVSEWTNLSRSCVRSSIGQLMKSKLIRLIDGYSYFSNRKSEWEYTHEFCYETVVESKE